MRISCLHTSAFNRDQFSSLFKDLAPQASVVHLVRDDFLTQAQIGGVDAVVEPMLEVLGELSVAETVLCTSTTLGPVIDLVNNPKIVRSDRPLLEAAAQIGPRPLVVVSVETARVAVQSLLEDIRGPDLEATFLLCDDAWPSYREGAVEAYCASIAFDVKVAAAADDYDCVVLAQASMAGAAMLLQELDLPVLSSPHLAVKCALAAME